MEVSFLVESKFAWRQTTGNRAVWLCNKTTRGLRKLLAKPVVGFESESGKQGLSVRPTKFKLCKVLQGACTGEQ